MQMRVELLDNFEAYAERVLVFVPVGAEHLEASYLGGGAHMFADTGADVVVADAYETDGVGDIIGQTVGIDALRQIVARNKLEGNG